jgi:phosphoribosylaminoimidazole carboxylase PurE protein
VTNAIGPLVGIVMGSRSDMAAAEKAVAVLDELGVASEVRVISAHRAPALLTRYATTAEERGLGVLIAIAGLAAHLPGVLAAQTILPVVGVPMPGGVADGLDALLSVVQMPKGVPVATVGNAENAALLAAQILGVADRDLHERFRARREAQTQAILDDPTNVEERPVGGPLRA